MAQWLKKVAVTPTRGNGFIIDSFNTSDNKHFNAPSLDAVNKRLSTTDSNILFNSDFTDTTRLAYGYGNDSFPTGWERDGDRPLTNLTNNGMIWSINSLTGSNSVITSPQILPDWLNNASNYLDFNTYFPITVSIKYYTWASGENPRAAATASVTFESKSAARKILVNSFGDGASFYCDLTSDGRLKFGLTANNPTTRFILMAVKAEYGASATPFVSSIKDAVIAEQIEGMKSFFVTETFSAHVGGMPPAGYEGNLSYVCTKEGYRAIGIISISGTQAKTVTIEAFFIDHYDNGVDSAKIYYLNGGSSSSLDLTFTVLYVKV